jgi:hypothetical protein
LGLIGGVASCGVSGAAILAAEFEMFEIKKSDFLCSTILIYWDR